MGLGSPNRLACGGARSIRNDLGSLRKSLLLQQSQSLRRSIDRTLAIGIEPPCGPSTNDSTRLAFWRTIDGSSFGVGLDDIESPWWAIYCSVWSSH